MRAGKGKLEKREERRGWMRGESGRRGRGEEGEKIEEEMRERVGEEKEEDFITSEWHS